VDEFAVYADELGELAFFVGADLLVAMAKDFCAQVETEGWNRLERDFLGEHVGVSFCAGCGGFLSSAEVKSVSKVLYAGLC
jgi:hypothetical protein